MLSQGSPLAYSEYGNRPMPLSYLRKCLELQSFMSLCEPSKKNLFITKIQYSLYTNFGGITSMNHV